MSLSITKPYLAKVKSSSTKSHSSSKSKNIINRPITQTAKSIFSKSPPTSPGVLVADIALMSGLFFLSSLFSIAGTLLLAGGGLWILSQFKFVRDFVNALHKEIIKDN